jgi:AcrR family transcriptional regulator
VPARQRNPRGEGSRLREDLLAGAQRILERTGSEDAVTLRAVAREVGISAPSIYAHFPDSQAIIHALTQQTFDEFAALLRAARDQAPPADRLFAICLAYLRFGRDQPQRYLTLFQLRPRAEQAPRDDLPFADTKGAEAFGVLTETIAESVGGTAESALTDATVLWAALHGFVTLRVGAPKFPWFGSDEEICRELVDRAERPTP